jgi:hypothetical protein
MGIESRRVYWVVCDGPEAHGLPAGADDDRWEENRLFATEDDALETALRLGWRQTANGLLLCSSCPTPRNDRDDIGRRSP